VRSDPTCNDGLKYGGRVRCEGGHCRCSRASSCTRSCWLITAILLFEYIFEFTSFYVGIPLLLFGVLAVIGTIDLIQTRHAVLRNYPLTAHIRFTLEEIRPEIRQYFLESEKDGTPFSRDKRRMRPAQSRTLAW
jgi:hypothetical protein